MPTKMPITPHDRFWMAIARANDWRVQPISWVMGCNHSPKPWRMPMDKVTMAAPHASTWNMDNFWGFVCMQGM